MSREIKTAEEFYNDWEEQCAGQQYELNGYIVVTEDECKRLMKVYSQYYTSKLIDEVESELEEKTNEQDVIDESEKYHYMDVSNAISILSERRALLKTLKEKNK